MEGTYKKSWFDGKNGDLNSEKSTVKTNDPMMFHAGMYVFSYIWSKIFSIDLALSL
jgi:hypothetical protein